MKLRCEAVKRPARNKNQWPRAKAVGRRAKGQRAGFATVACARFCESRLAFVARVGWGGAHSLKGWERTRGAVAAAAERREGPTWKYLLDMALLPDYLQDALDAFGRSCEDYELGGD